MKRRPRTVNGMLDYLIEKYDAAQLRALKDESLLADLALMNDFTLINEGKPLILKRLKEIYRRRNK